MKVKELIAELQKYDSEREVYDYGFEKIEKVYEKLWVDTNYPYDQPDEMKLIIE